MKKADSMTTKTRADKTQLTASHWGAAVIEVEDNKLHSIKGHHDDPDPSDINLNYLDAVDGPARVRQPAVRASYLEGKRNTKHLRGREQFIEVSWDTAEDLVVAALQDTIEQHGNQAIFCLLYTSPSPRDKRQSRMPSSA